jgi:toxin-antitoxin system PIN domain toxin
VTYLLDVNVLLALVDRAHIHHERAHRWFSTIRQVAWATCPLTQNGLVRIISGPAYPTLGMTPARATDLLRVLCAESSHVFWPDDLSLIDATRFDLSQIQGHRQITDVYLAALALANEGMLATLDSRIAVTALIDATRPVIEIIPA